MAFMEVAFEEVEAKVFLEAEAEAAAFILIARISVPIRAFLFYSFKIMNSETQKLGFKKRNF